MNIKNLTDSYLQDPKVLSSPCFLPKYIETVTQKIYIGRTKRPWRKFFLCLMLWSGWETERNCWSSWIYLFPPNVCTRNTGNGRSTFYIHLYPQLLDSDADAVVVVDVIDTVDSQFCNIPGWQTYQRKSNLDDLWYHPQKTITVDK